MVCFHHCQWNFSDYIFVPHINLEADVVPSVDETCSVMGFGHMTAEGDKCNVLHTMDIHMGTPRDCGSQDSVQNYVCGAATGQQESCSVDGGEPLLCKHGSSEFLIHGICKQGDCSAPQKHSKFLLLSYYRDWLTRTVPGLALSSVPQKDASSQREEWKLQEVAPEQNHQKTDRAEDKAEKCPTLAHPPPVHIHNRVIAKEEHTSANSKENISSSVRTISPSGDEERSPSPARDVHNPTGKQSESRNSDPVNTTFPDVPDGVPRTTTPAQLPSGDPAVVPPQNSTDNVSNVTVLLESLADGWYLSNATQSVPQLSGNKETLDLDRLEKVISENGAVLKFSYIVDTTNFSLPGYRSKSVEPVAKLHSSAGKEFRKSGAYSPNSILSNEIKPAGHKSLDGVRKSGPIPVDTGRTGNIKPQNLLPSGVKTPIPEAHRDRVSVSESSQDAANSSVVPPQNLSAEVPGVPPKPRPAAPSTLTLDPSQWEWLTKNALRIPKNPLQNPKILGKTLLFKQPKPKYDSSSRERLAEEYWLRGGKQASDESDESGFPRKYREKWAAQDMSFSHVRSPPSSVIMRIDPVHRPGKRVRTKTARPTSSTQRVPPSVSREEPNGVRPQRSLANGETHSGGADARIPRNEFARPDLSTDERRARSAPASPTLTAETGEGRASPSPSANGRRPEGTFFGVLSSSARARLKREGTYDANTLLADLASWPSRAGLTPSELTPPVSFLTAVNESYSNPLIPPPQSFYLYFKLLKAFLPGGNFARRLDMYKKKLLWGPPITYDEFVPITPHRSNVSTPEVEEPLPPPPPPPGEEEPEEATEGEGAGVAGVSSSSVPPAETESSQHDTTNEDAAQQPGGVVSNTQTSPSARLRLRRDVDTIGTELGAENESRPAGDSDTNYSGSPDGANISDQPDSGISVGSFGAGKATTPATIDTRHQTTLNTDDTPREAAVDSAGTQKGGRLHTADDSVLSTVEHKESTLSTAEATVPTANVRKVSKVDTGEATQSTVNTRRETEQLAGDNYSTSLAGDDGEGDAARMPEMVEDQNREQTDFYSKIKRLGTDDGTNAAQKAISIFGVVHTLTLVWILLPQV